MRPSGIDTFGTNAWGKPRIPPIDMSLLVLKTPTRTAGLNKIHPILGDNMLQPRICNNPILKQ